MHALGLEFGSAAQLSKRPGSVWNCLWGNALKRSPGIIRKSRVSYPVPGILSSATWPSLPKKHYNGLNQTKPKTNQVYCAAAWHIWLTCVIRHEKFESVLEFERLVSEGNGVADTRTRSVVFRFRGGRRVELVRDRQAVLDQDGQFVTFLHQRAGLRSQRVFYFDLDRRWTIFFLF